MTLSKPYPFMPPEYKELLQLFLDTNKSRSIKYYNTDRYFGHDDLLFHYFHPTNHITLYLDYIKSHTPENIMTKLYNNDQQSIQLVTKIFHHIFPDKPLLSLRNRHSYQ